MSRGEHHLEVLLANLQPQLDPVEYAFVQVPTGTRTPPAVEPLATFREHEGTTLVVTAAEARTQGWESRFPCRRVVLQVYSALEAVGMMAAVATWLADAGIPCNVIAAVNHDHLFVPADRAAEAVSLLETGARQNAAPGNS